MVGVYLARHGSGWRVAVTGAGPGVFRWTDAEAALNAGSDTAALVLASDDLNSDIHASAAYRAHLCGGDAETGVGHAGLTGSHQ